MCLCYRFLFVYNILYLYSTVDANRMRKPSKTQLKQETVDKIVALKIAGMSNCAIGKKIGCSYTTVKRYWFLYNLNSSYEKYIFV